MDQGIFCLPDGRTLGWLEVGDEDGLPVLAMHGVPGSRATYFAYWKWARYFHLRLLTVDRPGWGRSSLPVAESHAAWTVDLRALLAARGIESFAVLGASGGAVWACAVAAELPAQVLGVALVSGVGPYPTRRERRAFGLRGRTGLHPLTLRFRHALSRMAMPMVRTDLGDLFDEASLPDRARLEQPDCDRKESLSQGGLAAPLEQRLGSRWTFDLSGIRCPVIAWHGDADDVAPLSLLEPLRELHNFETRVVSGDHFAPWRNADEIFRWLSDLRKDRGGSSSEAG